MTVTFVNRTGCSFPPAAVRRAVQETVRALKVLRLWRRKHYAVAVVFVPPGESARWNRRYRRRAKAANVLSFDYGTMGEVLVAPAVVRREGRQPLGAALLEHIVHGVIHLAGVHHERSARLRAVSDQIEAEALRRVVRSGGRQPRREQPCVTFP